MLKKDRYLSVTITRIFMKFIGFWYVETWREQMFLHLALGYAILAICFAIVVEVVDLYHCLGDFYVSEGTSSLFRFLILPNPIDMIQRSFVHNAKNLSSN